MLSARCLLVSMLALSACCTPGPTQASPPATVAPVATTTPVPHDAWETASDQVITERVRTLFHEDFEIVGVQPQVAIATLQGVVTLTGTVETDRQRLVMAGHARATEGVTRVDNQIMLAP